MNDKYKPLIIALPTDFGPPIYYSPEEEFTLLLSQLLTAIFAGIEDLDNDQVVFALNELKNFIEKKWDRKAIYFGAGSAIILPCRFREKESFIKKIREIFHELGIPIKIKFWDDFGYRYNLVVFGMDILLRKNEGINEFISRYSDRIELWNKKANEYFQAGIIMTEQSELYKEPYFRRSILNSHKVK